METRNAIIADVTLNIDDGPLTAWLTLDYGGSGQGFGGYALYLPESYDHHRKSSPAGHFICRVLQIAGVTRWDQLKGKAIRVRADCSHVHSIGHIIKEDWFCPSVDLKAHDRPDSPEEP
jgi:hypothetical protein